MIAVTTGSAIEGATELASTRVRHRAQRSTNSFAMPQPRRHAVLNACYDDALDIETLYHGSAVVVDPIQQIVPTNLPRAADGPSDIARPTGRL
jgi:hypothetical protein